MMETTTRDPADKSPLAIALPRNDREPDPQVTETTLKWTLIILGCVDLLALLAVVMPLKWMSNINTWCGMGPLPDVPLLGYLTRSNSALYAFHGTLILYVSTDIRRYLSLIRFLSWVAIVHGIVLLGIDFAEKMPWHWTLLEAPSFLIISGWILWLASGMEGIETDRRPSG